MTTAPKKPAYRTADRFRDDRPQAHGSRQDSRDSHEAADAAQEPAGRILSPEAIEAILESSANNLRDRAMLTLAYDAALRMSDLCALRIGDVSVAGDCEPSVLLTSSRLLRPKRVPITPRSAQAVEAYIQSCRGDAAADEPLFVGCFGKALVQSGFNRVLQRHAASARERYPELFADIQVKPSDIRRSAAAHLLGREMGSPVISCILATESPRSTLQYYAFHAKADGLLQKGGRQWT